MGVNYISYTEQGINPSSYYNSIDILEYFAQFWESPIALVNTRHSAATKYVTKFIMHDMCHELAAKFN